MCIQPQKMMKRSSALLGKVDKPKHPGWRQGSAGERREHGVVAGLSACRAAGKGFPGGASGKEPACQCRRHKRHGFNPWVRKIAGGGHGNPFQYSCLENPMNRGPWRALVHRVAKNQTRLKRLSMHACTGGADNRDRSCSQGKGLLTAEQRGQGPS